MNSFIKLIQTHMRLYLREPVAFFFTIVFPALLLVMFGAIWGNDPFPGVDFGFIDMQVPALAGIVLGTVAFASIPITTATNREQGILRRFKATPMPTWKWMSAEITANLVIAILSMIVLVIIGWIGFGMQFRGNWGLVLIGFTLSAVSFMAMGYVVASLSPTPRIAQVAGQLIYFPMMFLSGAAIPLSQMPDGIRSFSQWLPMTHVVELLQDLWFGRGWAMNSVWILLALMVIGGLLSARLFRWE